MRSKSRFFPYYGNISKLEGGYGARQAGMASTANSMVFWTAASISSSPSHSVGGGSEAASSASLATAAAGSLDQCYTLWSSASVRLDCALAGAA